MRFSLSSLLAIAPFLSVVSAVPSKQHAHEVKESINPPRGWTKESPAPPDHIIELKIGLPQPNFHVLEQHLYEVSDPSHERYGAHLSKEEVEEIVAPHPESLDLVNEWLASHGFDEDHISRSPAKDWITIKVPVALAEKMLDTRYYVWSHAGSGDKIIRTTSYSLPQDLHEHVDVIQPTTIFGRFKAFKPTIHSKGPVATPDRLPNLPPIFDAASGSTIDPDCNFTITVNCLLQIYNAVDYKPTETKVNQIGLTGYLEEYANEQDLQLFYASQRPEAVNSSFKVVSVNGGLNNQSSSAAGGEANLDVQYALGISYPTPGTFYTTGGRPPYIPDHTTTTDSNEPYQNWLEFILGQRKIPQTISTSYGDDEQTVPESYARRVCAGFAQLGARGVSLTVSSGDGGVGDGDPDPKTQTCFTNDGRNATRFIPAFPASCPFVTAVGGTTNIPETGIFFSGGGFSNYFARPFYQDAAVTAFLDKLPKDTYKGLFNQAGRGYPDVSAQSNNFVVYIGGVAYFTGGTSASSPTFAGLVALLNDVRLSKKLPPLGFLNPLLYSHHSGFNDILIGNNPGCGTPGFNATKGWDAITGLGTPNFGKLKGLVTWG